MTRELIRSKAAQSLLTYDFGNSFTTISLKKVVIFSSTMLSFIHLGQKFLSFGYSNFN